MTARPTPATASAATAGAVKPAVSALRVRNCPSTTMPASPTAGTRSAPGNRMPASASTASPHPPESARSASGKATQLSRRSNEAPQSKPSSLA